MSLVGSILFDTVKPAFSAGKSVEAKRCDEISVAIVVDRNAPRELIAALRQAFVPECSTSRVRVFALSDEVGLTCDEFFDLAVIASGSSEGPAGAAALYLARRGIPCIVLAQSSIDIPDLSGRLPAEASVAFAAACSCEVLLSRLGFWICDNTDKDLAFAANFPFVRAPKVERLIAACARKNATVAAVPFFKEADLPVMATNEVSLLFSVAALYGRSLSSERILELLFVGLISLISRTIARRISSRLPIPAAKWAACVGIGYGATYFAGRVIHLWFDHNEPIGFLNTTCKNTSPVDE